MKPTRICVLSLVALLLLALCMLVDHHLSRYTEWEGVHVLEAAQSSNGSWQMTPQNMVTVPGLGPEDLRRALPEPVMGYYLYKVESFIQSPQFTVWVQQQQQKQEFGILTASGGSKITANLIVLLKVLREHIGCLLPVEVAYRGEDEMDQVTLARLATMFNPLYGLDLYAVPHYTHEMRLPSFGGWVAKPSALLHSRFQKVIMLDADMVPLQDPTIFLHSAAFLERGNLFWPDSWSSWVGSYAYEMLGLKQSSVEAALNMGKGSLPHDTESGAVMFDRVRHADVLHYLWWINTFAAKLYQHVHGDKDTFALAFALAFKAHEFRQISTPPGGAFHWGKGMLQNKTIPEGQEGRFVDGWQLVGFVQHSPMEEGNAPAFLHRTMNKWSINEEPWPVQLLTAGPMPPRWTRYYLAHDSIGQTKGRWWEHVVPDVAFDIRPLNPSNTTEQQKVEELQPGNGTEQRVSGAEPGGSRQRFSCHLDALYHQLSSGDTVGLVKSTEISGGEPPLPAIDVGIPCYNGHGHGSCAALGSGCEGSFLAIQAAYLAHKWLQQSGALMFPLLRT